MSTPKKLLAIFIALFLIASCDKEDDVVEEGNGNVTFSFKASSLSEDGRTSSSLTPQSVGFALKDLSVSPGSGYDNVTAINVKLLSIGEYLFSEPFELKPGNYQVTDFAMLNEEGMVIYLIPRQGSQGAHLVKKPLPVDLNVIGFKTTELPLEVVSLNVGGAPEDFGYTSFKFDVVEAVSFQIAVFAYDLVANKIQPAICNLQVKSGNETLYDQSMPASANNIFIRKGQSNYDLLVTKSGYTPFAISLTPEELLSYKSNEVLTVTLVNP